MKIEKEGKRLLIDLGAEETREQFKFFEALRTKIGPFFEGWEGENVLAYNMEYFSLQTTARHLEKIRNSAKRYGVEISEEAGQVFDETQKRAKEQKEEWEEEKYKKWESLKKSTQSM